MAFRKHATLQVLESWRVPAQAGPEGLTKFAHRVAFDYEPRPGYLYVRSRMISSRTNDNHDTFPAPEIEKGYKTFLGKPVFVNHHNANHRRARGVIVALALHRDRNSDGSPDTWVEGLMEVDAVRFPKLARAILAGKVNRTSMGVDVEWSRCSACGNKATSPAEYCSHLPAMKGKKLRKRNPSTGKVEEKLIHEICAGLSFFENSLLVEEPADPTAYFVGNIDARGLKKAAAMGEGEPDFRDHIGNSCIECGQPVRYARGLAGRGRYPWKHHSPLVTGHDAWPSNPDDKSPGQNMTYGGTHCTACGEPVKINLAALDRGGGWHHRDGLRRDHPATPADPWAVYNSIPGQKAEREQASQRMGDYMHGLMEDMHGGPLPRRPRGDEDQMPPDPFTAARRRAAAEPPGFSETTGQCINCGRPFGKATGDWRNSRMPMLCNDCAYGHTDEASFGKPPALDITDKGGMGSRQNTDRWMRAQDAHGVDRRWSPEDAVLFSESAKKRSGGDHPFFKEHPASAANIVAAYHDSTEDEKALGSRWYADAHHVAKSIARGDAALGAGLLSAYSPQTAWPVNMFNASRAAQGDPPGPGTGAMGSQQKSAMRILKGEHHSGVLKAPKTAAFAHLIEHGGDSAEDEENGTHKVVIDRHAMSVAVGHRLSKEEGSKAPLDQKQHYEHVEHLYRKAASALSEATGKKISPHQVQATTWLRQVRKNKEEDSTERGGGGKGRVKMQDNSKTRWEEHHKQHHVDPHHIPEENMHYHGIRRQAYGETRVPPQVDTLRMEECPVCGESDVWSGERCPVCGFIVPPSLFRDPDVNKAQQVRQQLDDQGEVITQEGAPGDPSTAQVGSGQDADDQLMHPDQVAPDGVPAVQGEGGPVPAEGTDGQPPAEGEMPPDGQEEEAEGEQEAQQGEQDEQAGQQEEAEGQELEQQGEEDQLAGLPAPDLECPACGASYSSDVAAQPGTPCPACRQGSLQPVGAPEGAEDPEAEDESEEEDEGEDMPGSKTAAALAQAQARRIAELTAQNEVLTAQLSFLASAAGVDRQLAQIRTNVMRRHADVLNPASPVPDPPEAPPTQTTEQALMPGAMDDPSRPGTTPGANTGVPARQTTTAITPGVEDQTPPATNLIDVTAPVQGTNPSQDGGVPLQQRRIETDVRIDPDPLKAHGPGIGGQGDNGAAFPWILDGGQPQQGQGPQVGQGQRAAALYGGSPLDPPDDANAARRTFASIRLAKLRVTAGLAQGEELAIAERIEKDASFPVQLIEHEIKVLSAVPQAAPQQRPMQRAAARSAPSLASVGAVQHYAPAVADADLDASDIFM